MSCRSRALLAVVALAGAAGCELVVDDGRRALVSTDADADAAPEVGDGPSLVPADSGPPGPGTDAAAPPLTEAGPDKDCSSTCLGQGTSCQTACMATQTSCVAGCQKPGVCQAQCNQAAAACNGQCAQQCTACFTQSTCAGANACPK